MGTKKGFRVSSPITIRMPRKDRRPFFSKIPSELVIDILSRLPIRTIVTCKCVCRSWRDLLVTGDFIDLHLSKSVPGLVIGNNGSSEQKYLKIYEIDDELGLEHHHLHYRPVTKIDYYMELTGSSYSTLQGSANGLVLLHRRVSRKCDALYVCNPVTREYIELRYNPLVSLSIVGRFVYGFGVSRMTGQHKVVLQRGEHKNVSKSICLVYTLGTAMWRSITPPAPFFKNDESIGVCLNGNLHWLVHVLNVSMCILCFDLETETFNTFSLPSRLRVNGPVFLGLVVLGDCLCVSDNNGDEDEVFIWLMKEYGDDKSWTKEFVITKSNAVGYGDFFECAVVNPIKVFRDGDILMALDYAYMLYYSNKTKTIHSCEVFNDTPNMNRMKAMLHTSSFFPLSSFINEKHECKGDPETLKRWSCFEDVHSILSCLETSVSKRF